MKHKERKDIEHKVYLTKMQESLLLQYMEEHGIDNFSYALRTIFNRWAATEHRDKVSYERSIRERLDEFERGEMR